MFHPEQIDPAEIKRQSEAIVLQNGGRICDWLPPIEFSQPRDLKDVIDRALILNALLQLAFGAPSHIIAGWIDRESLAQALTPKERAWLSKPTESLTEQERTDLFWYIEALWAILWATGLIDKLPFDSSAATTMASLCPDLQRNEDGAKFRQRMKLRPYAELYAMRDLAYRFHWWTRDAHHKGEKTGAVELDFVMERRKALEWILDRTSDWDDMNLST